MHPIMKKYIKPESTLFTMSPVQMLAASSGPGYGDVEGEGGQLSNRYGGWNSADWSNSADDMEE